MNIDKKLLKLAYIIAQESLDPSTQVGAVIYKRWARDMPSGSNNFPDGIEPLPERYQDRDTKLVYTEHAERSAIYNAAKIGFNTNGATLYCPWFACIDCARAIICAGISDVVGHKQALDKTPERWLSSVTIAHAMLKEAGVNLRWYDGKIGGDIAVRFNGEIWTP